MSANLIASRTSFPRYAHLVAALVSSLDTTGGTSLSYRHKLAYARGYMEPEELAWPARKITCISRDETIRHTSTVVHVVYYE